MHTFTASYLRETAASIFAASRSSPEDSEIVADSLVGANLAGHDSHGIMRIPEYLTWVEEQKVNLSPQPHIAHSSESFAVFDGDWGWGQVMARRAMQLVADKASEAGVATVFCRNCCHIGRVGEYPEILARQGFVSVMFVNTHGAGRLVAPWGGVDRRLSANPIGIGVPRENASPMIVDISTCAMAEGKLRNLMTAGQSVPPGSIVDGNGHASTNPADFYGPPEGALLAFGGHKGFALSMAAEILAGALSGAGCSRPDANRVGNSFMITAIDTKQVRGSDFGKDVSQLVEFVKSSRTAEGVSEIMIPGDPEAAIRKQREEQGIPVHPTTWERISDVAMRYGVEIKQERHAH